jgi:hypothetical protein
MGNYKAYIALSALIAATVLVVILNAFVTQNSNELFVLGLVQIPLGLFQLFIGLRLALQAYNYPQWVRRGIVTYWALTVAYFLGLAIIRSAFTYHWSAWVIWLYVVPWGIAVYQFGLVWRMAALRKRQLQKRDLLQLFNY